MSQKVLIPWAMPEKGKEWLRKAKVEVVSLHGPNGEIPRAREFMKGMSCANVLIPRGNQKVSENMMVANPKLRGIANYGVGYDNIDVSSATKLGIPVTNTPEVLTETTADLTWGLLMATARRIPQAHHYTISGHWKDLIE